MNINIGSESVKKVKELVKIGSGINSYKSCFFGSSKGKLIAVVTDLENTAILTLPETCKIKAAIKMNVKDIQLFSNGGGKFVLENENVYFESEGQKISGDIDEAIVSVFSYALAGEAETIDNVGMDCAGLRQYLPLLVKNTSKDKNRYVYSGVYFAKDRVCATDGRRAVKVGLGLIDTDNEFILGKACCEAMAKHLKKNDFLFVQIISVNGDVKRVVLNAGDLLIVGRVIDDKFPDIDKVIPTEFVNTFETSRKELLGVIEKALPYSDKQSHQAKFACSGTSLEVSVNDMDKQFKTSHNVGTALEESGVGFNLTFWQDILKNVGTEKITVNLGNERTATVLQIDKNCLGLIMPMKL